MNFFKDFKDIEDKNNFKRQIKRRKNKSCKINKTNLVSQSRQDAIGENSISGISSISYGYI